VTFAAAMEVSPLINMFFDYKFFFENEHGVPKSGPHFGENIKWPLKVGQIPGNILKRFVCMVLKLNGSKERTHFWGTQWTGLTNSLLVLRKIRL
jgi:hypothetical protein